MTSADIISIIAIIFSVLMSIASIYFTIFFKKKNKEIFNKITVINKSIESHNNIINMQNIEIKKISNTITQQNTYQNSPLLNSNNTHIANNCNNNLTNVFNVHNNYTLSEIADENMNAIFEKCKKYIDVTLFAKLPQLSKEWVFTFLEYARNIFDDELQDIWAKLLSGELKSNGSISIKTMNALKLMSLEDAQFFNKIIEYTSTDGHIFLPKKEDNPPTFNYVDIAKLNRLNLIDNTQNLSINIELDSMDTSYRIHNKNYVISIKNISQIKRKITILTYTLTDIGEQLRNLNSNYTTNDVYFIKTFKKIAKENTNFEFKCYKISRWTVDKKIECDDTTIDYLTIPILSE